MDHAGHSQPPPHLNHQLPSPRTLFTASQNNNWSIVVVPRDSNAKVAAVPGQNGLSTTLTLPVSSSKPSIHTPPEVEHARPSPPPESSSTKPSHGQCSAEPKASRALWEPVDQSQSASMPQTGVPTRAEFSAAAEPPPSTTPLP